MGWVKTVDDVFLVRTVKIEEWMLSEYVLPVGGERRAEVEGTTGKAKSVRLGCAENQRCCDGPLSINRPRRHC